MVHVCIYWNSTQLTRGYGKLLNTKPTTVTQTLAAKQMRQQAKKNANKCQGHASY